MKIETTFNFGGFYESLHSDIINSVIETEEDYYFKELTEEKNKFNRDLLEENNLEFFELYDYQKIYINYSKELVKVLGGYIKEENKFIKSVEFIQLDSPKFYNYSTDTMQVALNIEEDCKISVFKDLNLISHIRRQAKKDSQSYDGYIAFKKYRELIKLDSEYIFSCLLDYYYQDSMHYIIEDLHEQSYQMLEIKEEYKAIFDKLKY